MCRVLCVRNYHLFLNQRFEWNFFILKLFIRIFVIKEFSVLRISPRPKILSGQKKNKRSRAKVYKVGTLLTLHRC